MPSVHVIDDLDSVIRDRPLAISIVSDEVHCAFNRIVRVGELRDHVVVFESRAVLIKDVVVLLLVRKNRADVTHLVVRLGLA